MTPVAIVSLACTALLLVWCLVWLGFWVTVALAGLTMLGLGVCGCTWLAITEIRIRLRVRRIWARGGDRIELARAEVVRDGDRRQRTS